MSERDQTAIREEELHAYVDGLLASERVAAVDEWLSGNPEEAGEVAQWQEQNRALRAAFGALPASGAADLVLLTRLRLNRPPGGLHLSRGAAFAAACLFLALGAALGAGLMALGQSKAGLTALDLLPQEARANFAVYASEVRHPVEVGADEESHLVAWLSKRLGTALPAPDLSAEGFSLVGGRLVSFSGGPGALLMYQDGEGKRVTLLVGSNDANRNTGFLFDRQGDVQTFYWIDGRLGYALSGQIGRDRLEALAHEVYDQL